MLEIIKIGEKTYYIPNATNIGLYLETESDVWVIDTGIDPSVGKKIYRLVSEKGWNIKGIISTHAHADHIGGNSAIVSKTGCPVLAHGLERSMCEHTILNPGLVFGGFPRKELRGKFLLAKPTDNILEISENLPCGLELIELPGHTLDMIGIRTPDNVYFLADSVASETTIDKYKITFMTDIKSSYETLEKIAALHGEKIKYNSKAVYIPSHCELTEDISYLVQVNRKSLDDICAAFLSEAENGATFEGIVSRIFHRYDILMNSTQHALLTSTLRSFMTYLENEGKLEIYFEDNYMKCRTINEDITKDVKSAVSAAGNV